MMNSGYRLAIISLVLLTWLSTASTALAQGPDDGGQDCWACHRRLNLRGVAGTRADIARCLDCHGDPRVDEWAGEGHAPVHIDEARYAETLHSQIACTACHVDVARNPHRAGGPVACADCHATILTHVQMGAPHMSTDCAACHQADLPAVKDEATGRVVVARAGADGTPLGRTAHTVVADPDCDKCHVAGNSVGAPAVELPARSVVCMACHDASPVVKDPWSAIGLLIFGVGMVIHISIYLRGAIPGHAGITTMQKLSYIASDVVRFVFSRRIFRFIWGIIADGIFLRRVLQESVGRWVMHTLIYLPFLARFLLGLVTWLGEAFWPAAAWTQTLANKDAPGVAFAYDFLALLVILGVLIALYRRFVARAQQLRTAAQDRLAIFLLGAAFLLGIIAEATRLLSAGTPQGVAVYSFLGYAVAALLRPLNLLWTSIYPVIWYLHASLVIAVVAYLPFSKFMHILAGPFIAGLDTARERPH